jgi:hypothetical protein
MKKFSDFNKKRPVSKIFEQDQQETQTLGNLPQNIQVTVQGTQGGQDNQDTQVTVVQPDQNTEQENQEKEQNKETEGGDVNVVTFFSKLFESREMAHVYHLQVRGEEGSYAKHMALGSFYDGVLGLIDDVIEIYQGQYGIVDGYDIIDTKETKSKDAVNYFEEVAEYIKHAKKCINSEDTHLHNIIDEIVALIYKTLYKLKFNK